MSTKHTKFDTFDVSYSRNENDEFNLDSLTIHFEGSLGDFTAYTNLANKHNVSMVDVECQEYGSYIVFDDVTQDFIEELQKL